MCLHKTIPSPETAMPQQTTSSVARLVCDQRLAFGAKGEILSNAISIDHAILIVAPDIAFRLFVLFDDLNGWVFGGDKQLELGSLLGFLERLNVERKRVETVSI